MRTANSRKASVSERNVMFSYQEVAVPQRMKRTDASFIIRYA